MNAIARFISVVSARFAPCNGRSEAMISCGEPPPLYCSFPQEEAGRTYCPDCLLEPPRAPATTARDAPTAATSTPSTIRFLKVVPPFRLVAAHAARAGVSPPSQTDFNSAG